MGSARESPIKSTMLSVDSVEPYSPTLPVLKRSGSAQTNAAWHGGMPTRKRSTVRRSTHSHVLIAVLPLKATATRTGNIAPVPATESQRRCRMNKERGIIYYTAALAVFRKWLAEGIITEEELAKIETIIAEKYGLSSCSIYR